MQTFKHLAVAALVAGSTLAPVAAAGDDDGAPANVDLAILDILFERGLIDAVTYEELSHIATEERREQQRVDLIAERLERMSGPADDEPMPKVILDDSGLSVRSADGKTRIDVGGRVQADATWHNKNTSAGVDITDGTELRRARLELKGNMRGGWIWAAEGDFAGNKVEVKDFWFGARTAGGAKVTFGHQKQPFSTAVEMSSNDISFTERGVDTDLIIPFVDRAIGARVDKVYENSFFAAGIFGDGSADAPNDDDGWGAVARFVHTPIRNDEEVLHLAARGAYRVPMDSAESVRIRSETTHMSSFRSVDTGVITGVSSAVVTGVEAAYANGPWTVMSEINRVDIDRSGASDAVFRGWHVQGALMLTGESRAKSYNLGSGEFKRIRPEKRADGLDVTSGGAWELAARLAQVDLEDGPIAGGEQTALTVSLNWYPADFVRFLLGWTRLLDTRGGTPATHDAQGLDAVTLRGQMTF